MISTKFHYLIHSMDPIDYKLPEYDNIPQMQLYQRNQILKTRKLVLFFNFVVDYTDFSHPGYNDILDKNVNNNIQSMYQAKEHSFNADLVLCHRIIGKDSLALQEDNEKGRNYYNKIKDSQINRKHQALMKKFDFNQPIIEQIQKLTAEQKQFLTVIPKQFKNPEKIRFLDTPWKCFIFEQHFWISFCVYWSYVWMLISWVVINNEKEKIIYALPFTLMGGVMWTMVEYYFHRIVLHFDVLKANRLGGHLLHHSFPNLKNKVAVSVFDTSSKIAVLAIVLLYFFETLTVAMIFIGLIGTLVNYDSIHYYCHFGPQIDIGWLKSLRIHHLKHHYRDQTKNFGVTNFFWDWVFGTQDRLKPKQ